ncbi:polysaccharide deacetylase family protein [Pseudonocardia acaciae]|uniref:polysaccharide deacetylase family protein n=1 Tax=Pseudonocardia acaciae TaxID=551276 RepID=UPI000684D618|nr:polysaccharide deacetylase family protein [Pseudonocardia acaciae]
MPRPIRPRRPRTVHWPDGATIAVSVSVAFESFERHSQYRQEYRDGGVDHFSLSFGDYGARAGVWRLLDLFAEQDVPVGFSVSGLAARAHPGVIEAIRADGHELVAHGWANDIVMAQDLETDRELVRRTLDAIGDAAGGQRPSGWSGPGNQGSPDTQRVLVEEGLRWTGDDASDDLPFVVDVDGRPLVVLPKTNIAANDLVQWMMPANGPDVFLAGFTDTFDTLYAEGVAGAPGWAEIVVHCHMGGRPAFVPALRAALAHARRHPGVWWARKGEIAEWALDQGFRR